MKLLSLNCNHCGASLDVPENTRFVTCSHCQSKLKVEESGGAYFTSVLEKIEKNTDAMAGNLEIIKLQNELERLDRERQAVGATGNESAASKGLGAVAIVIFMVLWISVTGFVGAGFDKAGGPSFLPFGMMLFGIVVCIIGLVNTLSPGKDQSDYHEKRQRLLERIRAAEKK